MSKNHSLIPVYARIIAFFFAVLGIGIGIGGYIKPDIIVSGFMADSTANQTMAMLFTGRNLAMGIGMLLVGIGGVPESFALIFILRILTEIQDAVAMVSHSGDLASIAGMLVFIGVALLLEIFVVVTMFGLVKKRDAAK